MAAASIALRYLAIICTFDKSGGRYRDTVVSIGWDEPVMPRTGRIRGALGLDGAGRNRPG